jgi:hypothetical protein
MQPDYVLAIRQLQWIVFEFYLGSTMLSIGLTGMTVMAYGLLRKDRNGQN